MICQRDGAHQKNGVANKINLVMDYYLAEQRLRKTNMDKPPCHSAFWKKCHFSLR